MGFMKEDYHIPFDMLIESLIDPMSAIVNNTYPSLLERIWLTHHFSHHRTILALANDVVNELNEHIMTLIPRETKTYLSLDVPCSVVGHVDTLDVVHTLELLNTIATLGLPNHKLKLMIGFHIMLLRNIDQSAGLCNGTRFIVTQMNIHVLQAKVIFGSKIGEKVFIPKLSLIPYDPRIPFKF